MEHITEEENEDIEGMIHSLFSYREIIAKACKDIHYDNPVYLFT